MRAAEAAVRVMEREATGHTFGIPGAAINPLYAALKRRCQEACNACAAKGGSAWDHSGIARALEQMANFEIGQQAD